MKRLAAAILLAAASQALAQGPAAAPAPDAWLQKGTADLILLDKIRGQPMPVTVKVGDGTNFGSLTIKIRGCYARPPDQPADSTAFLDVTDTRTSSDVFHGWILANAPSVSQMQHPLYDIKLVSCR